MKCQGHGLQQLSIHGVGVELRCDVPVLCCAIEAALGEFLQNCRAVPLSLLRGVLRPFVQSEVLRHLSPTATRFATNWPNLEIYHERERFWIVDERWGLTEINFLKGQWQSWILPAASCDFREIVKQAVLWPLAQLLRVRGLSLIPAASVARGDFGMLLIAPFGIAPELSALIRAGFKIIGQQWSALREEAGRIAMLSIPGQVEREGRWIDLSREYCGATRDCAMLNAIILVDRGRRAIPSIRPIAPGEAMTALRSHWPIIELHPQRRYSQMCAQLAQRCAIFECRLSRRGDDLLAIIEQMQDGSQLRRERTTEVLLDPHLKRARQHAHS